jgi:putative tryptophan/tyrosine transport system substrate-binding protein
MRRRAFALGVAGIVMPVRGEAQPFAKVPRVGVFAVPSAALLSARIEGFRQGLRELGYVEGQNILVEYRMADGRLDRLPELAAELVRIKVDVIVTSGPASTQSAKAATTTIPIVMAQDADPVGNGFVTSLARPGGNITGLSSLYTELSGKQLEILQAIVPRLSRIAVLGQSTEAANTGQILKEVERAAGLLGIQVQYLDLHSEEDIEPALEAARKARAGAVLILGGPVAASHRVQLAELAARKRLPAIAQLGEFAEDGGLVTYGVSLIDLWRRAASYVDKILKGARPTDLPVEQPTRLELILNLKAARRIGLTIPAVLLARADRVIR